jgi:hypothetical protein
VKGEDDKIWDPCHVQSFAHSSKVPELRVRSRFIWDP